MSIKKNAGRRKIQPKVSVRKKKVVSRSRKVLPKVSKNEQIGSRLGLTLVAIAIVGFLSWGIVYSVKQFGNNVSNTSNSSKQHLSVPTNNHKNAVKVKKVKVSLSIGDSYRSLAKKVYGDETKWHLVYDLNKDNRYFKKDKLLFRPSLTINVAVN